MSRALTRAELESDFPEHVEVLCRFYLPELNSEGQPTWPLSLYGTDRLCTKTLAEAVLNDEPRPFIYEDGRLWIGTGASDDGTDWSVDESYRVIQRHALRLLGDRYTKATGDECRHVLWLLLSQHKIGMWVPGTNAI